MFGFIFGTACLIGLIITLRRSRHWRHHHRHGHWGWRSRMRWLFESLDTSPGQEKVFVQAADEMEEAWEKLRREYHAARASMARAMRGEAFDAAALHEMEARQDELMKEVRQTMRASFSRIHEALDAKQRQALADMLEHGWHWRRGHGGCGGRGHGWHGGGYRYC